MTKRGESTYTMTPAGLLVDGSLQIIAKDIGEILEKHYPGWQWLINPDQDAGVIYIYSLMLSGEWGYIIQIAEIQDDPARKQALIAGGEILDRYNIRRGKYHRDLLKGKITDLRGNYIPDITDRLSKQQKKVRDQEFTKAVREGKAAVVHKDSVGADGKTYRQIAVRIGEDDGGIVSTGKD